MINHKPQWQDGAGINLYWKTKFKNMHTEKQGILPNHVTNKIWETIQYKCNNLPPYGTQNSLTFDITIAPYTANLCYILFYFI